MNENKTVTYEEFHRLHRQCPMCGSEHLSTTYVGIVKWSNKDYVDNVNTRKCSCGWAGKTTEMTSPELNNGGSHE